MDEYTAEQLLIREIIEEIREFISGRSEVCPRDSEGHSVDSGTSGEG